MIHSKTLATTAVAGLALLLVAAPAFAASGFATGSVNVRSGPGAGNAKVGVLQRGEAVDVGQCQGGWCYVSHSGPDGWVSANYLSQGASPRNNGFGNGNNGDPDVNIRFGIGANGPNFGFSFGEDSYDRFPAPPFHQARACFFSGENFSGRNFCVNSGGRLGSMPQGWNDQISSVQMFGTAAVTLCQDNGFGGFCRTTRNDEPALGPYLNDEVSSIRVR